MIIIYRNVQYIIWRACCSAYTSTLQSIVYSRPTIVFHRRWTWARPASTGTSRGTSWGYSGGPCHTWWSSCATPTNSLCRTRIACGRLRTSPGRRRPSSMSPRRLPAATATPPRYTIAPSSQWRTALFLWTQKQYRRCQISLWNYIIKRPRIENVYITYAIRWSLFFNVNIFICRTP